MASAQTDTVWWKPGSRQTPGLSLRFVSNAPEMIVQYKLSATIPTRNTSAVAANSVDLYAIDSDGLWHWASSKSLIKDSVQHVFFQLLANDNFHKLGREYQLFLPLFSSIDDLKIGVPQGSLLKPLPVRAEKPIVVLGSSIVQGEGATRPGLAWTNILSRNLDRDVLNFSFGENDFLEKGLIEQISDIDARIYLIDGLLDLANEFIDSIKLSRYIIDAVKIIRARHPLTPILCTEHAGYTDGYL
ncbi:MAG: SGNH/GDSL hydrolase family protein, partial [bacterium]